MKAVYLKNGTYYFNNLKNFTLEIIFASHLQHNNLGLKLFVDRIHSIIAQSKLFSLILIKKLLINVNNLKFIKHISLNF